MNALAPSADQLELTLIGPGFGESALIHIGNNRWIVVDSCIDSQSGRPAALAYLEGIGVEPRSSVELIITSHWHDDHIGGMSQLVSECPQAKFCCAAALSKEEFQSVSSIFNKTYLIHSSSGVSEIYNVFRLLRDQGKMPIYAIADRPIFTTKIESSDHEVACQVVALSPSDAEFERFLAAISAFVPSEKETKYRLPVLNPNDLSVAVWVKIGMLDILLGADLEEHHVKGRGWMAVIESTSRPQGRAVVFKVAHHGSVTGHHDAIWTDLLATSPYAVLTPWNRGSKLPTGSDCERIKGLTNKAYVTSCQMKRLKPLPKAVTKTLDEGGIKVTAAEYTTGFVGLRTLRDSAPSDWTVALSPNARQLVDFRPAAD
jgi:hypothetical protein